MKFSGVVLRAFVAFVTMSLAQMITGIIVPMKPVTLPHLFGWLLLITAVTAAALTIPAVRSEWRGWRLGVAISAIPVALSAVNSIEGSVFLTNSGLNWRRIFLYALISSLLMVPVWAVLFGRRPAAPEHYHPIASKSRAQRAWRFVVSDFAYLFLYFTAGMIVFPFVKDFYATQHLPSMGALVSLQLLIRGPVFVLMCIGLTRMLGLSRLSGALTVGLVFTLISGVAPLLAPNPLFPDAVRWAHFCEVTSSNFVFGAIVAWLWGPPKLVQASALAQAA